jgi:hypothetical protein
VYYFCSNNIPVYIGVNDFEGKILVGAKILNSASNTNRFTMLWGSAVLLPIEKFYLGSHRLMYNKGGSLYIPSKDRYNLFDEDNLAFSKNDNTNDYLLSGTNAIGKTGRKEGYKVYDADRTTYTNENESTSDYVDSNDYDSVDFLSWNDSEVYKADTQGRFKNSANNQIEVGYAEYYIYNNDDEFLGYAKKYINIVFNKEESKWFYGAYSTSSEPIDGNFTMTNEESETIDFIFYQYGMKFQTAMSFDEGGVK